MESVIDFSMHYYNSSNLKFLQNNVFSFKSNLIQKQLKLGNVMLSGKCTVTEN